MDHLVVLAASHTLAMALIASLLERPGCSNFGRQRLAAMAGSPHKASTPWALHESRDLVCLKANRL